MPFLSPLFRQDGQSGGDRFTKFQGTVNLSTQGRCGSGDVVGTGPCEGGAVEGSRAGWNQAVTKGWMEEISSAFLVDSDRMILFEVAAKSLKVIRRGLAEVFQRHGSVDLDQTTQGALLDIRVQLPDSPAFKKALGFLVREALDHCRKKTGIDYFGDKNLRADHVLLQIAQEPRRAPVVRFFVAPVRVRRLR